MPHDEDMTARLSDDGDPVKALQHRRRAWAKMAPRYDKQIGFFERRLFGEEHRPWACERAIGETLEVAIGTGLNLPHYPSHVGLTGIDLSPEMLSIARSRATDLGRSADLREADAQDLPFEDASFDTVLCTYSLCNVPDERLAVQEMRRVLRPDGRLILVDHVRSSVGLIFWMQKVLEFFSLRIDGDHLTRRPSIVVEGSGFEIRERHRTRWGIVERLVAVKLRAPR